MKGIKFKKLTAMFAALSLLIMLVPIISMTANAQTTEVTNEAELKSALESGATDIAVSGKVTISSNSLTINSGVTLSITRGVSSEGITVYGDLAINAGVTLTVKGTLMVGEVSKCTNRGTIDNNGGTISGYIYNYGTIDNNGGTMKDGFYNYYGGTINNNKGTISGGTNEGTINNSDKIDISGRGIENWNIIINSGTIDNRGGTIENRYGGGSGRGTITNSGTIDNSGGGTIRNERYCTITNDKGTIDNNGCTIKNYGTIDNTNGGKIANLDKGIFDNVGTYNDNTGGGSSPSPSNKPTPTNASFSPYDANTSTDNPTTSDNANTSNEGTAGQSDEYGNVLLIAAIVAILAIAGGCILLLRKRR